MDSHEPVSIDVGSKLLLISILLGVFGTLATVLLPVMTAFMPAAPGQGPERIVGALFPGIIVLVVAVVLGVIAGLFLGYAKHKYPTL